MFHFYIVNMCYVRFNTQLTYVQFCIRFVPGYGSVLEGCTNIGVRYFSLSPDSWRLANPSSNTG